MMKKLFIMLAAGLSGLVACAVSWRTPTYTLTARLMDVREALTTFVACIVYFHIPTL